jgi:hypothetical protein
MLRAYARFVKCGYQVGAAILFSAAVWAQTQPGTIGEGSLQGPSATLREPQ